MKCVIRVELTELLTHLCVSVVRYQEELPKLISSRPDKHVTQSELVKLMEWKLTVSGVYTFNHNNPNEL